MCWPKPVLAENYIPQKDFIEGALGVDAKADFFMD